MGDYLRANAIESSMKITGKLILGACLALILISLAAAIILPIAIVFFDAGELDFSPLLDFGEFIFAYFVFGPPILSSGALAVVAFVILKDRLGAFTSVLIVFGIFILFSVLLTFLAYQLVIEGIRFIIDSA